MTRRQRRLGLAAAGVFAAAAGTVLYLLFTGPRMKIQPNLRPYQMRMPPLPAGVVPVEDFAAPPPSPEAARDLVNPLAGQAEDAATLAAGRTYYGYYCVACHGDRGDGRGPVGESFDPAPPDLAGAKVRAYTDGQLLRAMLTSTGHQPVLPRVIRPEHRWPLVLHVRKLQAERKP